MHVGNLTLIAKLFLEDLSVSERFINLQINYTEKN